MSSIKNNGYVGSILLDFPVQPKFCDEAALPDLQEKVSKLVGARFGPLTKLYSGLVLAKAPGLGVIILLSSEGTGASIQIRTYPSRSLITLGIDYDLQAYQGIPALNFNEISELEAELAQEFESFKKTAPIPEIKRGLEFDTYFTTSDSRLLEYDIQEMVFDDKSEFQHVQIGRSINYGNLLILDGLVNLAESDLAYSEAIMQRGKMDYTGKDVLILGGGDGALLYELRKENAKSITMIEIDDMVMKACKIHLRKACGDTLDNYKTENYEIIVGDCIPFMVKAKEDGKLYDVIFGDLTDVPINAPTAQGEIWDFFRMTLQLAFSILKEDGVYLTHGNGATAIGSLKMLESTIKESLPFPITLKREDAFVPSFKEKWAFYEVKRVV